MRICVFGAAGRFPDEACSAAAREVGALLAQNNIGVVFGAGSTGLMGQTAKGVSELGGELIGVIPERLNQPGIASPLCTELIVTKTMHERKAKMESLSDGFITLGGGFGTLEELMEVMTLKQLGYIDGPICILNTGGIYDKLLEQFERCVEAGFVAKPYMKLFYSAKTPVEAVEYVKSYKPQAMPDKVYEVLHGEKDALN